ncbi:Quinone oxidoreductase (EC [Olavius sp. associated proteobacterium Delta 1]|nr:Quinone oxidoreductase (EC [Olavius sp. associated proteobacterium Delta 1]
MQAWTVHNFGRYQEQLKLEERDLPQVTGSEALIKVKASGINFFDLLAIAGKYQVKAPLPFVPGGEAAGEVVEAGEACDLKVGERVMTSHSGAFAEFMIAPQNATFRIPPNMSYEDAAAFQLNYQTSYFALEHRAGLKKADYLLVHGGAGGVGTAAIQIGKALGAKVIATAGSAEKLQICRQCGAGFLINYRTEDFIEKVMDITDGKGADVIYDPVGGDVFDQSTRCIAWEGRIIVIGFTSGRIPEIRTNKVLLKNMSVVGLWWGNYRLHNPQLIEESQQRLYQMYADGAVKPVIHSVYEIKDLPKALELIENRKSYGKVVIKVV